MSAKRIYNDVTVASFADLQERGKIVVEVEGTGIGLYYEAGEVRAWHNLCPHQGGPVCQGKTMPRTIQLVNEDLTSGGPGLHPTDRNIVCPWHGLEFNVLTGVHTSTDTVKLRAIACKVVDDDVIVSI